VVAQVAEVKVELTLQMDLEPCLAMVAVALTDKLLSTLSKDTRCPSLEVPQAKLVRFLAQQQLQEQRQETVRVGVVYKVF
jgi:hypothetical protein